MRAWNAGEGSQPSPPQQNLEKEQPVASSSRVPMSVSVPESTPTGTEEKRSKWDDGDERERDDGGPVGSSSPAQTVPAIKRRLVRPKKLRKPDSPTDISPVQAHTNLQQSASNPQHQNDTTFSSTSIISAEPVLYTNQNQPPAVSSSLLPPPPLTKAIEPLQSQQTPGSLQSESSSSSLSHPPISNPTPLPPPPRPRIPLSKPPRSKYAPLRTSHPPLLSCRSVYSYTRLNHIEEGTYGVVFRARCNDTKRIYALKKLKLDEEKQGFPITSLREVMALMVAGDHENVVGVKEIVVGDTLNQVFIVMPFIEHDLKTLLADMPHPFIQSEVKTIMRQLLSAVAHCHANWILHRDLKTSNLLMNNRGQIKVADFGLARKFGDPLGEMTQLVVTLWYRSPELLLGAKEYTTAVDMWSVGCIFAELMQGEALFPGRGEIDQINKIFSLLGRPNDELWPGYSDLPLVQKINPIGPMFSVLRQKFKHLSYEGHNLLSGLLAYDPERRTSAEEGGRHPYFTENPLPKHPDLFASFPSQAAGERRHKSLVSPSAPVRLARDRGMDKGRGERGVKDPLADLDSFV
ncbi:CMGC/CDK protein kinase [Kwoniella heveanensis CBS 569]|nr:CMGC/CDK protein kinase [Kwoniella heveanensis CBS 569]